MTSNNVWPYKFSKNGMDSFGLEGRISFSHYDRDGRLVEELDIPNTITNGGLAQTAGLLNGVVTNFFEYIAIGTGTTAAAASQTALVAEATRSTAAASRITTTETNDTAQLLHTFSFVAGSAITESSIQDAATEGTMLSRQTFNPINVSSGDTLAVTWKVQAS